MTDVSIRFTLLNGTKVNVKKVTNNKYDFELQLAGGNRRTFIWITGMAPFLKDANDEKDKTAFEAIEQFKLSISE